MEAEAANFSKPEAEVEAEAEAMKKLPLPDTLASDAFVSATLVICTLSAFQGHLSRAVELRENQIFPKRAKGVVLAERRRYLRLQCR